MLGGVYTKYPSAYQRSLLGVNWNDGYHSLSSQGSIPSSHYGKRIRHHHRAQPPACVRASVCSAQPRASGRNVFSPTVTQLLMLRRPPARAHAGRFVRSGAAIHSRFHLFRISTLKLRLCSARKTCSGKLGASDRCPRAHDSGSVHPRSRWRYRRLPCPKQAGPDPYRACYHTTLFRFQKPGRRFGIIGYAIGDPFYSPVRKNVECASFRREEKLPLDIAIALEQSRQSKAELRVKVDQHPFHYRDDRSHCCAFAMKSRASFVSNAQDSKP